MRRAHEHAVGHAERIGSLVGQVLDQPHGVVAHVADDAGGDRRQLRQADRCARRQQGAQRLQGRRASRPRRHDGFGERLAVDLGPVAEGAPDDVGSDADDGVAPAHGAALHRLQEAADGLPVAQLQGGRDGRLEVGDEPRPHHLRLALAIALGERGARGLGLEVGGGHVELGHRCGSCRLRMSAPLTRCSVCSRAGAQRLLQGGVVDGEAVARLQAATILGEHVVLQLRERARPSGWLACSAVGAGAGMTSATRRMMRALPSARRAPRWRRPWAA